MSTYTVTFDRVGRRGGRDGSTPPAPLTVAATTPDDLASEVHKYVRPYLGSRDLRIFVDLETMTGGILAGMNNGGSFTIEAADEDCAYDGMTNADVIGADELYEMDRDAEFAHDAAADALAADEQAGGVR